VLEADVYAGLAAGTRLQAVLYALWKTHPASWAGAYPRWDEAERAAASAPWLPIESLRREHALVDGRDVKLATGSHRRFLDFDWIPQPDVHDADDGPLSPKLTIVRARGRIIHGDVLVLEAFGPDFREIDLIEITDGRLFARRRFSGVTP
jgi:hypothetical protein